MIQLTPQMRILLATKPVDFRKGIDGLVSICKYVLRQDPFSGYVFVFTNRRRTSMKLLCYDGTGFWLMQKRLSRGRLRYWPDKTNLSMTQFQAHELQILLLNGDPRKVKITHWRRIAA